MKRWDEIEKNQGFRPPTGKTASAMKFMLAGSIGLLITFVSLTALEIMLITPKVAP